MSLDLLAHLNWKRPFHLLCLVGSTSLSSVFVNRTFYWVLSVGHRYTNNDATLRLVAHISRLNWYMRTIGSNGLHACTVHCSNLAISRIESSKVARSRASINLNLCRAGWTTRWQRSGSNIKEFSIFALASSSSVRSSSLRMNLGLGNPLGQ